MNNIRIVTTADIEAFCAAQQIRSDAGAMRLLGEICEANRTIHTFSLGGKYARIIRKHPSLNYSTSVVCFIDMTNGNIHKADGWKKPCTSGKTKGVRGNIFAEDGGDSVMSSYGTNYLR
jgi:hypothetical protein